MPQHPQQQRGASSATQNGGSTSDAGTLTEVQDTPSSSTTVDATSQQDDGTQLHSGVAEGQDGVPAPVISADSPDPAALQRYAAELVESARELEQLDREGRLDLSPSLDGDSSISR